MRSDVEVVEAGRASGCTSKDEVWETQNDSNAGAGASLWRYGRRSCEASSEAEVTVVVRYSTSRTDQRDQCLRLVTYIAPEDRTPYPLP